MDTVSQSGISAIALPNTELLVARPAILLGCDTREIIFITGSALFAALVLGFFLALFAGLLFLPLFAVLMWVAFSGLGMVLLRGAKRQKPHGYYVQTILRLLAGLAKKNAIYIREQSGWDTRRHRNT